MASKSEREAIVEAITNLQRPNARGRVALLELLNYTTANAQEEQPEAADVIWGFLDLLAGLAAEFDAFHIAAVTAITVAYPPAP
jgi:hypothetical protein